MNEYKIKWFAISQEFNFSSLKLSCCCCASLNSSSTTDFVNKLHRFTPSDVVYLNSAKAEENGIVHLPNFVL